MKDVIFSTYIEHLNNFMVLFIFNKYLRLALVFFLYACMFYSLNCSLVFTIKYIESFFRCTQKEGFFLCVCVT